MTEKSKRFRVSYGNDPRGNHWQVVDDKNSRVTARAWASDDAIKLMNMHESDEINPDYESRHIGYYADRYI